MTDATSADPTKGASQPAAEQRAREVFIAAKSHDLRTPINAIIGYSELLLEDAKYDDELWAEDLEKIYSAGRSLLATVNEILSAEKVESGELDMSDMASLGERIRLELRNDISAVVGYVEMLIEDEAELNKGAISDLERIKKSAMRMTDLINDIIAFGADEAGIADAEAERSEQSDMVKGVVATLHQLDALRTTEPEAPGHILLVDDDETNRDLLSRRLEFEGHTFEMAKNGEEALDLVRRSSFDVILLDIIMPVMDGYQATRAVRELGCEVPIIALTANALTGAREECLSAGCTDYLSKPINRATMLGLIASHTRLKSDDDA